MGVTYTTADLVFLRWLIGRNYKMRPPRKLRRNELVAQGENGVWAPSGAGMALLKRRGMV